MDKIIRKKGSIEVIFICVIVVFFMFIFFLIYLLYSKININVYRVKQDLFYIVQNAVLALDKEELSYNNFEINEEEFVNRVNILIKLNYDNVKLNYLNYDKTENKVYISVEVDFGLDNFGFEDKIIIDESVKVDMMELEK